MKRIAIFPITIFLVIFACSQVVSTAEVARTIERELKVEPGGALKLDIETGSDVTVIGWDKNVVRVFVQLEGEDIDDFEIEFDESSGGLEIETKFKGSGDRHCRVSMEIMVPERFDINLGSMGGDLTIENVEGTFEGKTLGGDIELLSLKGEVRLVTYGGDIEVEKSELDGRVKTLGGDISITDVKGDIKGKSLGGSVKYDNVSSGGKSKDISISSMGGDLDIDYSGKNVTAKTFGGDVDVGRSEEVHVTTFGGDISVDEAPRGAKVKTMGGDINIRSAGTYAEAKTMGGDITIDAIDGWVEASTMGGDVTVTMVGDPSKGERRVELKSVGGDIELTVPDGLSMAFDIELAITKGAKEEYRIISDFDMNIEKSDKWVRKWGQKRKYIYGAGEVGGGEHRIKLRTTNGNITIRKG
jgi:DUF4097 and DUF4098 domain-containing protein YvlB